MTVAAIRTKLMDIIAHADDKKVKALYTLLAIENENDSYTLTDEQMSVVNERRASYLSAKTKASDWREAHNAINNKKLMERISAMNDKKISALYTLLEDDINSSFALTDDHIKILDEERKKHIEGKSKSYSWEEAKVIIRRKK